MQCRYTETKAELLVLWLKVTLLPVVKTYTSEQGWRTLILVNHTKHQTTTRYVLNRVFCLRVWVILFLSVSDTEPRSDFLHFIKKKHKQWIIFELSFIFLFVFLLKHWTLKQSTLFIYFCCFRYVKERAPTLFSFVYWFIWISIKKLT